MLVTVSHYPRTGRGDFPSTDKEITQKAVELYKERKYTTVCDMVIGGSLTSVIEQAFILTNNAEASWPENTEVSPSEFVLNGYRESTCKGDIVEFAGEVYVYLGCGSACITEEVGA